ncbi:hypothetical protein GQX73_g7177 [Xylaria multiplex]|uniref:Cupin 2 conserved barrel domain-containing protein n=1 Tax=Xylaria multiplex TaxID=323545 RepID=A0A7C8MVA3_9PEZI|nr:hypothetical protein GQX73_g7177 [Xylaria multiplex]
MDRVITRPGPASVKFNLTHPTHTIITLPSGSIWSSGLHFHATHDEYLVVQRGSVRVRRDSEVQTVTVRPSDAPVEVAYPARDSNLSLDGEDVVVVERTDPADGEKPVFFWNLNGVILQQRPWWWPMEGLWAWWILLQLFVIFVELDNVPVMLDVKGWLVRARLYGALSQLMGETSVNRCAKRADERWSLLVLRAVHWVGRMLGVRAVRREFMPKDAYERWKVEREGGRKRL